MHNKFTLSVAYTVTAVMLLLTGCGKNPQESNSGTDVNDGTGGIGISDSFSEEEIQLSPWQVAEYRDLEIDLPHPEGHTTYDGWINSAVDTENFYLLVSYKDEEEDLSFYLYKVPLSEGDIVSNEVTSLIRWGELQVLSPEQFPDMVSEEAVDSRSYGSVIYLGDADSSEVLQDICPADMQSYLQAAIKNNTEEYILVFRDKTGYTMYRYQKTDAAEQRVVVIEAVYGSAPDLQEAAATYTRTHPGVTVVFKTGEFEARENTWNRMTMEIAAGRGSDILVVYRNQLGSILDSGMLTDMTSLIPKEVLDQIYPGVLEAGYVDGKLYSLVTNAWTCTLFADRDVWKESGWTLDDVIPMLNGTGREFIASTNGCSGDEILQKLLLYDLEHSKFLDLQAGTCNFNSAEFQELLTLCKEMDNRLPNATSYGRNDGKEMGDLISGKALAYEGVSMSFKDYCRIRDLLGDDYFTVGYPAESGSGSYWQWSYSLAVNCNSENLDVVQDILLMLLEQSNVKRDAYLDGKIIEDWTGTKYYTLNYDINNWFYPLKEDGTTYVEEYTAYLDSCVPFPLEADYIRTIIIEEAAPFFSGDKDVKTVCEIIQNRAQLYLDER